MDNIIKKIELEIDGVGIVLTPEQAKKLHKALGELMGIKAAPIVVKEKEYVPVYDPPYRPRPWTIWSGTTDKTYTVSGVGMTYTSHNGTAKLSV